MTRTVRVVRATEVRSGASVERLEPGLYVADDSGTIVTLTPSGDTSLSRELTKTMNLTSVEFALLLNSHDLVYVSW